LKADCRRIKKCCVVDGQKNSHGSLMAGRGKGVKQKKSRERKKGKKKEEEISHPKNRTGQKPRRARQVNLKPRDPILKRGGG